MNTSILCGKAGGRLAVASMIGVSLVGTVSGLAVSPAHAVEKFDDPFASGSIEAGVNKIIAEAQNGGNKDSLVNSYGDTPECVAIQHQMDKIFGWIDAKNIAGVVPYSIAAAIKGCKFLGGGNPYHVKNALPGGEYGKVGEPFSLQTRTDSCRGIWVEPQQGREIHEAFGNGVYGLSDTSWRTVNQSGMRADILAGADNPNGCTEKDARTSKSQYQFISRGKKENGRDTYYMAITEGPMKGKCVTPKHFENSNNVRTELIHDDLVPGDRHQAAFADVAAVEGCRNDMGYWAPGTDSGNGWQAAVLDGYTADGKFLGVMDVEEGSRGGNVTLYKYSGGANQAFHFRPPGQAH
ncbi:hypothetical protein ACIBCO_41490 [Streptomyces violascens]|uniref:hypothetical protein n=1 Tax=Streptomyces violascens TaxID=67381 RepID=UPI0037AAF785